jgi:hypothetical protein
MPLTQCPDDVSVEILAFLPLGSISRLPLVRKAWKAFIDGFEETIYHSAAISSGLVSSTSTSLADEKHALGDDLDIAGWKSFCARFFSLNSAFSSSTSFNRQGSVGSRAELEGCGTVDNVQRTLYGYSNIRPEIDPGLELHDNLVELWGNRGLRPTCDYMGISRGILPQYPAALF